jgi:hypothetical protein
MIAIRSYIIFSVNQKIYLIIIINKFKLVNLFLKKKLLTKIMKLENIGKLRKMLFSLIELIPAGEYWGADRVLENSRF